MAKKKGCPEILYVRVKDWGNDRLTIIARPETAVAKDGSNRLAVYKYAGEVRVTNKTTVTPVEPAKKAAKKKGKR